MHISESDFECLKNGLHDGEKTERLLEHIAGCPECADKFAEVMAENLKEPNAGFHENLAYKIRDKKKELFYYSLRVCAAAAAAIAIVFTVSFQDFYETAEKSRAAVAEKTKIILRELNENIDGGYRNEK